MKESSTKIFFYSSWLSNFKNAPIKDPQINRMFTCSEQAYMWRKADFFGDEETKISLEQITDHNPMLAKNLGRVVKNYNETAWECVRYGFMVYVNLLKYSQNLDLKKKLLATQDKTLVEASPIDPVWGIGLAESEDISILDDMSNWRGRNLLGKSLVKVRNLLT